MKIATKTGDGGTTGLLFGKRVPKTHERIKCVGEFDECNTFIGLAKFVIAKYGHEVQYCETLEEIQRELTYLMGEVNCEQEKIGDYIVNFPCVTEADLVTLDHEVEFLQNLPELVQKDWVLYGRTEVGSVLDVASKICRRAERSLWEIEPKHRELLYKYVNRLSDFLYLLARFFDHVMKNEGK